MSLESWKQEYYPVPADEVSKEDAVKHSLQKWIGLRAENRIRHGIQLEIRTLRDDHNSLNIDGSSCALCVHYLKEVGDTKYACTDCPLATALGQPCDAPIKPYNIFTMTGNVEPMIKELQCLCTNSSERTQAASGVL